MSSGSISAVPDLDRFRHDAVIYRGPAGFLSATVDFIRTGLAAREPVLVAVLPPKIDALRGALGAAARKVEFVDMAQVGRNPARIIPAWREFLDRRGAGGQPVRGIGEPMWAGRRPAEVDECHIHEALLNTAFDDGPAWRLRCPYDAEALGDVAAAAADFTHPTVVTPDGEGIGGCGQVDFAAGIFDGPALAEPAGQVEDLVFGGPGLTAVRHAVDAHARGTDLPPETVERLALAVHEIAANSLKHGGGRGALRLWREPGALVYEVRDRGRITEPLVGRRMPSTDGEGGRGVWLANQICDLVQIRSTATGTTVRMHVWL